MNQDHESQFPSSEGRFFPASWILLRQLTGPFGPLGDLCHWDKGAKVEEPIARFQVCGREIKPPPRYTRECGIDEYRLLPATAGIVVDNTGEICNVKDKCISDKYGAYGACSEPLHVSSFNVTFALIKKQSTATAEVSAKVVPPTFKPWSRV